MTHRAGWLVLPLVLAACGPERVGTEQPPPVDTDTEPPKVLTLDTSLFIPQDTGPVVLPNNEPTDWVTLEQLGSWRLSPTSPPYTDIAGQMTIQEWINDLDPLLPEYTCDVVYSLTGQAIDPHTCPACDFVMEVEHFVVTGAPSNCNDPDTPMDGTMWQLGFDSGTGAIFLNYYGTDVWLPWYNASRVGADVLFDWTATLAIELEDTGT